MNYIKSATISEGNGHYSQAIQSGNFIFISGQLPSCQNTSNFKDQLQSVLNGCLNILEAAGCSFNNVVQTSAFIVGINNWNKFDEIYKKNFGTHKPARVVIPVHELHYGYSVEVQMIAHLYG